MMLPARTFSLPNFFTPRRLLSLSRPLRDEPPAFLCAMSNYFFGDFLAAALAGAAFFVDPVSAFALGAAAFFAGPSALLGTGFSAPAASALLVAGFSVGLPETSASGCASPLVTLPLAGAAAGGVSAFDAVFFCSFWSPIATIFRIVCCWRCPFLRR